MMKITAVTQQKKDSSRYSVFCDEKYVFSLAADQLKESGLKPGQELSQKDIDRFLRLSDYGKLRDRVYKWLSIRHRSAWEIDTYLKRQSDDEEQKSEIKKTLKRQGYMDDHEFAAWWISSRQEVKLISRIRLKQELLAKRVPMEVIDQVLVINPDIEIENCRKMILKRQSRYSDQNKLKAYLARQGFSYDTINRALQASDEFIDSE
jgi:regulatory protein